MAETKDAKMAEAVITEEMITDMRSKIGLKLRTEGSTHNEVATRMAILKFAEGIGDPNPLWSDEEHAKKTRYGSIIAPPSFLWSVFSHVQFGWRGLGGFHSGCDIEFCKPMYLDEKVAAERVFTKVVGPVGRGDYTGSLGGFPPCCERGLIPHPRGQALHASEAPCSVQVDFISK